MENKFKIGILVGIQVALIMGSFLFLTYFQTQQIFLGNSINIAGLNRFLTSNVISETAGYIYTDDERYDPISAINQLKENIYLLKTGGQRGELTLISLPDEFEEDWIMIEKTFLEYEKIVSIVVAIEEPVAISESALVELDKTSINLIQVSDNLANNLSLYSEDLENFAISIELVFIATNVGAHIFLVLIILRILAKEELKKIKAERLAVIGKMGASLAHDLRNPLTVIKGSIDLLKIKNENKINDFNEKQYQKIEKAISRIEHQTKDVLDFVRTKPLEKSEFSAKDILKEIVEGLEIPDLVSVHFPEKDVKIFADKNQIQTLFANLIHNSLQAFEGKEGSIFIRTGKKDGKIVIEFEDSGLGIPDKILPLIFEPLFTTKNTGTGLGLVSCKRIVENHGGKISVKTNPTIFTIDLPDKASFVN